MVNQFVCVRYSSLYFSVGNYMYFKQSSTVRSRSIGSISSSFKRTVTKTRLSNILRATIHFQVQARTIWPPKPGQG